LRGGVAGSSDLKKDRIVPFFLLFFLFCASAFAGTVWVGSAISSSVDGGEDSEDSESVMLVVACAVALFVGCGLDGRCARAAGKWRWTTQARHV
jgi:hypothetical protein